MLEILRFLDFFDLRVQVARNMERQFCLLKNRGNLVVGLVGIDALK